MTFTDNSLIAFNICQKISSVLSVFIPVDAVETLLASTSSASCAIRPICTPGLSTTADLITSANSGLSASISSFVLYS